jgi:chromosome segregation ATPase
MPTHEQVITDLTERLAAAEARVANARDVIASARVAERHLREQLRAAEARVAALEEDRAAIQAQLDEADGRIVALLDGGQA